MFDAIFGKKYGSILDYIECRRDYKEARKQVDELMKAAIASSRNKNDAKTLDILKDLSYRIEEMNGIHSRFEDNWRESITGSRYV